MPTRGAPEPMFYLTTRIDGTDYILCEHVKTHAPRWCTIREYHEGARVWWKPQGMTRRDARQVCEIIQKLPQEAHPTPQTTAFWDVDVLDANLRDPKQ